MRFIKIYKRTAGEEFGDINLELVVWQKNLTPQQYDDLDEYFTDTVLLGDWVTIDSTTSFEVTNYNEELENCPLPDGAIIMDNAFIEGGQYIVVLGCEDNNTRIKMGVTV